MSETKEIMEIFGVKSTDGIVRGTHLAQILSYLQRQKSEEYSKTASKLALLCGMSKRSLHENYLQGIEDFGIINVKMFGNNKMWNWVGISALKDLTEIIPEKSIPVKNSSKKQERKQNIYDGVIDEK